MVKSGFSKTQLSTQNKEASLETTDKYAPEQENVIGNFSFKGGKLIRGNAPSIVLNLDALK